MPDPLLLEPVPEPLLGEPMPLLLGLGVLPLDDPLLDGLLLEGLGLEGLALVEPEVPPLELLLPLDLNAASHSWREIEPSLFLSTVENDGVEPLAPVEALGEAEELLLLGEAEELLDAPPEVLGEDELGEADEELEAPPDALPEDLLSVALGLELGPEAPVPDEVLCAAATLASAKRAAAVAVPTTFNNISDFLLGDWGKKNCSRNECNRHACKHAPASCCC